MAVDWRPAQDKRYHYRKGNLTVRKAKNGQQAVDLRGPAYWPLANCGLVVKR